MNKQYTALFHLLQVQTPQSQKLSEKLQHFESAAKAQTSATPSSRNVQVIQSIVLPSICSDM